MLNLFKSLQAGSSYLGVDIGTTSVKIVELERGKNAQGIIRPRLINYGILETTGYLERFNTAIQTSTLNLFEQEVISYLKLLLNKSNFQTRQVLASLPTFASFSTLVELPLMAESETVKAMNFHLKQYIPMPLASVTLDWFKVGERTDAEGTKKQQLFLIAVPTNQIENYKKIFAGANLQLKALEIETLSLARSLTEADGKTQLIIDIGSRSTAIAVVENGFLKFSSQTDFAGASLTQTLASGLNITVRRAENLKKQKGLASLGSGAERELSTQMLPILDAIINEVKRVKDNFEITSRLTIQQAILSGGGAGLLGIENYFTQELGVPTAKADPFRRLDYSPALEPLRSDLGPLLGVAIGLAMRET